MTEVIISGEFHVGFTGSRTGITVGQIEQLRIFMERYALQMQEGYVKVVLHHGDCTGGDEAAHIAANDFGWAIEVHPGTDKGGSSPYRAYMNNDFPDNVQFIHEECPYAERNMDIVTTTAMLLATPSGPEVTRSGTWATVRAAERMGRPVMIFWPNGEVEARGLEEHEH